MAHALTRPVAPQKLAAWQRIMGTPTIQCYHQGRQVGNNVEETNYARFMKHIRASMQFLNLTS